MKIQNGNEIRDDGSLLIVNPCLGTFFLSPPKVGDRVRSVIVFEKTNFLKGGDATWIVPEEDHGSTPKERRER